MVGEAGKREGKRNFGWNVETNKIFLKKSLPRVTISQDKLPRKLKPYGQPTSSRQQPGCLEDSSQLNQLEWTLPKLLGCLQAVQCALTFQLS